MDSRRFTVYNKTRDEFLSPGLAIVDAVLEPLRVLKVLIEGLPEINQDGLWFTHFKGVPVARTLSPFDLVYLDGEYRVVHCVALSENSDFAPFKGLPETALVLPARSIASTGTRAGDQLIIHITEQTAFEPKRISPPTASPVISQGARSLRDLTPASRFSNLSAPAAPAQAQPQEKNSPLDNFFAAHASPTQTPAVASSAQPQVETGPARSVTVPMNPAVTMQSAARALEPAPEQPPAATPAPVTRFPQPSRTRRREAPLSTKSNAVPAPQVAPAQPQQAPSPRPAAPILPAAAALASSPQIRLKPVPIAKPAPPAPAVPPIPQIIPPPQYLDNVQPEFEPEEPPTITVRFLRWLFPELTIQPPAKPRDRRKASRLPVPGLIAHFFTGGAPKPHNIQDISITGFYMKTDERWMPGTIIRMTLQRIGATGDGPVDAITVHSRVVRWGADGGGFEFVLSGFLE